MPRSIHAWYGVAVLLIAYSCSFLDRQLLSLMVEPLKQDLDVSDTQISLLHGFAFALFYTAVGLPIGRLVDTVNSRAALIAVGIALWSLMTAACAFAPGFGALLACRIGVGVGEATLSPAAYSLIADYFPRERLGRALSIYSLGISIGAGVAFAAGGLSLQWLATADPLQLPSGTVLQPWRTAFLVVGLPGLLVAALALTIRNPVRRSAFGDAQSADALRPDLRSVVRFLMESRKTFGCLFVGLGLASMVNYAVMSWTPTLFIRKFGFTVGQIGTIYGAILMVSGSAGMYFGGWYSDFLARRGRIDASVRVVAMSVTIATPIAAIMPLVADAQVALGLLAIATFFLLMPWGVAAAAVTLVTPARMRGQVSALYLLTINLIGLGLGATAVALVTDFVFVAPKMLPVSMSAICVGAGIAASLLLWGGLASYRRSATLH